MTLPRRDARSGRNSCAADAYELRFRDALERLHEEHRYRVFADIERISGRFPAAKWRRPDGSGHRNHHLVFE